MTKIARQARAVPRDIGVVARGPAPFLNFVSSPSGHRPVTWAELSHAGEIRSLGWGPQSTERKNLKGRAGK